MGIVMDTSSVFDKTAEIIYETSGASGFTAEASLKEDCGLDSLSLVTVIIKLEQAYGIRFRDSDLEPSAITYVDDLVKLTEGYL